MTRILLVDDNQAVRKALRSLLERHENWSVCAEAANGREAIEACDKLHPDVILLDFKMPEMDGLDAAREITRRSQVPILMVSMFLSEQLAAEAHRAGVRATCPKEQIGCVVQAVEAILKDDDHPFPGELKGAA